MPLQRLVRLGAALAVALLGLLFVDPGPGEPEVTRDVSFSVDGLH